MPITGDGRAFPSWRGRGRGRGVGANLRKFQSFGQSSQASKAVWSDWMFKSASSNVTVSVTGQSFVISINSLLPFTSLTANGLPLSVGQGSVSIASGIVVSITGVVMPLAVGSVFPSTIAFVSGIANTVAIGNISKTLSIPIAGQSGVVSRGTVTPTTSLALSGSAIPVSSGALSTSRNFSLSGQSSTVSSGAIATTTSVGLSGLASSILYGSLSSGTSVSVSGQPTTISDGNVSVGGNVIVNITGLPLVAQRGFVAVLGDVTVSIGGTILKTNIFLDGVPAGRIYLGDKLIAASEIVYVPTNIYRVNITGQSLSALNGSVSIPLGYATWLKFNGADGSTTFTDESGKAWTANGNAQIDTAQKVSYLSSGLFDGTGDYLSTSTSSDFAFGTGDFTVEMWLYVNASTAAWSRAIEFQVFNSDGGGHMSFNGSDSAGVRRLGWQQGKSGGGGDRLESNSAFPTGVWTHYAVARQGNTTRAFVGGVLQSATITASGRAQDNFTNTACIVASALDFTNNYMGSIDELRITKGLARYTASFTPENYPSVLLHFNGTDASTTFTDESGRTWTVTGNAQIDTAQSKFGGASGLFDGNGDRITTPHATDINLSSGDFTIEGWFRLNATPSTTMYLIDKDGVSGSTYASYAMYVSSGSKLVGYVGNGTTSAVPTFFTGTTTINLSQWYHFAMTKSGTTIRVFLDGALEASGTGSTMVDGAKTLYVGYSQGQITGANWNGWIDEVRVTKGLARYTSAFTPPTAEFTYP